LLDEMWSNSLDPSFGVIWPFAHVESWHY
jgi:hypothetical protein